MRFQIYLNISFLFDFLIIFNNARCLEFRIYMLYALKFRDRFHTILGRQCAKMKQKSFENYFKSNYRGTRKMERKDFALRLAKQFSSFPTIWIGDVITERNGLARLWTGIWLTWGVSQSNSLLKKRTATPSFPIHQRCIRLILSVALIQRVMTPQFPILLTICMFPNQRMQLQIVTLFWASKERVLFSKCGKRIIDELTYRYCSLITATE